MRQEHEDVRLEFAHYVYGNCQRLINLADAKAGACFATSGAVLPFVLSKINEVKNILDVGSPWIKGLLILVLGGALLSMSLCLLTTFSAFAPRVVLKKKEAKGHIFFSDINRYQGNHELFYQNFCQQTTEQLLEDYALQINVLSKILQRKYLMVRRSIILTGVAVLSWFLLFALLGFFKDLSV